MAEIVISIASKVAEYLVAPISQGATYLFFFKQFIGDVEKAKQQLGLKLADVKKRMEEADQKTEEIMPSVKKWLDDVNAILEEVHKMQQELEGRGNKCFNVSRRYSLAKQMENKAKQMMDLKQNSIFEPFSQLKQLPSILNISSKGFIDFNSRKSTYNHVLKAIKDDNKKMVGLYGIGGSGKTTFAKQVGREMNELKFFDKVIMAIISKPPNVINIQQQIADQIGLQLQEATQLARAQRLYEGLKNKKILIILDDVWEHLRLEDFGISLVEGCHILLTTRLRNVCVSMDCETMIELPLITKEEAWDLFKKHANMFSAASNMFHDVGRKIIDECKELPIAVVAVGNSLKEKPIEAWESALWRLKHFQPLNVGQGLSSAYACLELSYDGLPSSTAKSLLLLCSMFPEDHEIHKEDLIRFSKWTLELDETIVTMEDVRREILDALQILLDSCLVMSIDERACIKMHDLVRDVALWIAKKQGQAILVDSHAISNILVSNHQSLKDTKALSLWNLDENFKLPNQMHCPTLEIMLLHRCGLIEDLQAIYALKVLALITISFTWNIWWLNPSDWSIPRSIVSLTNLHSLCLRGINLGDISFLGELKELEILDLHGSWLNELPAVIANMKMLKLLDIFGCKIEKSPLEVIGKCEQLEELYFWDKKSAISENFSLSRLKRYAISDSTCDFGKYGAPFQEYLDSFDEALRYLCIQGFKVSALNSSMKDLIHRANFLWLHNCGWDYKDINFGIKHLGVSCCQENRFIIDNLDVNNVQTQEVFSDLVTLSLDEMQNLEQVFQDSSISCSLPLLQELCIRRCPELRTCILTHTTITSLPKLRKLEIYDCSKVKWLFSCSLASNCPSLEEIIIKNCSQLERLIDENESAQGNPQHQDIQDYPCGYETNRAYVGFTAKSFILNLKVLNIRSSGRKKYMFEVQVKGKVEGEEFDNKPQAPSKLSFELCELRLVNLPELEYIWKGPSQIVSLYRLEHVSLQGCQRLKNIFTPAIVASLPKLRKLTVRECEECEGILCEESLKNLSSSSNICFPKLEEIRISYWNKVRWFLSHSLASHCPSLEEISIRHCSELERLVDSNCDEARTHEDWLLLLKLKILYLDTLPKLREIFKVGFEFKLESLQKNQECLQHKDENERVRIMNSELLHICLQDLPALEYIWKSPTMQVVSLHRLEVLTLLGCSRLKNIFTPAIVPSLPELMCLTVKQCEECEGIFCEESLKNISSSSNVCFPKLLEIDISYCNKMRWLLPHSLASHCPSLAKIWVTNCSEIERLVDGDCDEATAHDDWLLFLRLKNLYLHRLPKLREIFKGGLEYKMDSVQNKQECLQHKDENERVRIMNMELLHICLQDLPALEYIWKSPIMQVVSLHRLEFVTLLGCPRLKNIFTPAIVPSLPELTSLTVKQCEECEGIFCEESLKNISSSSNVCFPKLLEIDISYCNKMRWLLPHSLASHCPSLAKIWVTNCSEIERLVDGDCDEATAHDDWLLLLRLKNVYLHRLPKLREIFKGGLEYKMDSVQNKQECLQHKDENERVRIMNSELHHICLQDLPALEYIWKSPIMQVVSLHRLIQVTLQRCSKLKNILTLPIVTNFPMLRALVVENCDEWEGIFCEGSLKRVSSSTVCFPELEIIFIFDCHKVRRLFSYSLASQCPSLKKISICGCSQLEGVVQAYEGEVATHHERLFPKLNDLHLIRLPKLTEIYPSYEFNHISGTISIEGCPNICKIPLEFKAPSDLEIKSER